MTKTLIEKAKETRPKSFEELLGLFYKLADKYPDRNFKIVRNRVFNQYNRKANRVYFTIELNLVEMKMRDKKRDTYSYYNYDDDYIRPNDYETITQIVVNCCKNLFNGHYIDKNPNLFDANAPKSEQLSYKRDSLGKKLKETHYFNGTSSIKILMPYKEEKFIRHNIDIYSIDNKFVVGHNCVDESLIKFDFKDKKMYKLYGLEV